MTRVRFLVKLDTPDATNESDSRALVSTNEVKASGPNTTPALVYQQ
jgi:hypothetical protein